MKNLKVIINASKRLSTIDKDERICRVCYEFKNGKPCNSKCLFEKQCEFYDWKDVLNYLNTDSEGKIKLTKKEKAILKSIVKKYKYIARDCCGTLWIYAKKPNKQPLIGNWGDLASTEKIKTESFALFNHLFKFIKWEDEEPYEIKKLLEEEKK